MYQKTVFETAHEFFKACDPDSKIRMPHTVYVVFDGDTDPYLSGEGAENFDLEGITQADMIEEAFTLAETRVHLT